MIQAAALGRYPADLLRHVIGRLAIQHLRNCDDVSIDVVLIIASSIPARAAELCCLQCI